MASGRCEPHIVPLDLQQNILKDYKVGHFSFDTLYSLSQRIAH